MPSGPFEGTGPLGTCWSAKTFCPKNLGVLARVARKFGQTAKLANGTDAVLSEVGSFNISIVVAVVAVVAPCAAGWEAQVGACLGNPALFGGVE